MDIIKNNIPKGRKNRPGVAMKPQYITIHDTANTAKGAGAQMHAKYLQGDAAASQPVSWHFTVDDKVIVQHIPIDEHGWHAGDGSKGPGNLTSIGIEICENSDGDRAKAEDNAARLVADLLKETGLSIDKVVQHNHWSGKNCPHIIRSRPGGWEEFIAKVRGYLNPPKPPVMPTVQGIVNVLVDGREIDDGYLIDGRTFVPLRAVGDALGIQVGWDAKTRTASLKGNYFS